MGDETCIKAYSMGLCKYYDILKLQRRLHEEIVKGMRQNMLLLLRHDPVFTIGQAGKQNNNFLVPVEMLAKQGIQTYEVERGGDITYHGPGQLMAYPLWHLEGKHRDLVKLVRNIEEVIMRMLEAFGLTVTRKPGLPGIWMPQIYDSGVNKKIASVGLAVRNWVTYHGVAVNIREEGQELFQYINPCGLNDTKMTSVEKETGFLPPWNEVEDTFIQHFVDVMGCRIVKGDVAELLC
jgi:lipoate-protein ligase B